MGGGVKLRDKRKVVAEAQNWRCCFCGVRMLDKRENFTQYARQNGIPARSPAVDCRVATTFRIDGGKSNRWDNLAVGCAYCVSAKGDMPALAWMRVVEMNILAGTHPPLVTHPEPKSITYRPKPVGDHGRRPRYAYSEFM